MISYHVIKQGSGCLQWRCLQLWLWQVPRSALALEPWPRMNHSQDTHHSPKHTPAHYIHIITGVFIMNIHCIRVNTVNMNSNWPLICGLAMCHTWPVEVRARDDWLPAHTLRMNIPWSASTTLGLYTRLVSPWPSLPANKCQQVHIEYNNYMSTKKRIQE